MNKAQFTDRMAALLAGQSPAEREQLINYYIEMIDDRMEAGMSEEEAVAALGEPEALVQDVLPLPDGKPGKSAGAPVSADGDERYVDALNEVRIRMYSADTLIRRQRLENGAAAQLTFSDPEAFETRMEGGVLEIIEKEQKKRSLFGIDLSGLELSINGMNLLGEQRKLTLTLADTIPQRIRFESRGGDLEMTDVAVAGELRLTTASGDIELSRCACNGTIEMNSRSGDVTVGDTEAAHEIRIEGLSGDVELRRSRADALRVRTTSGDVKIDRAFSRTLEVNSVSGDVELEENETAESVQCSATSGDIDVSRPIAPRVHLSCVSGDITARLENRAGGYDLNANTFSGSLRLPKHWDAPTGDTKAQVIAKTVSGDIRMEILD